MKKTLLAAALALGFTGVAQAETSVTLYGILDTGIGYTKFENDRTDREATRTGLYDGVQNGNRWGMRGSEDLGNGLKAVFQLESGFNLTSGTQAQSSATSDRLFGRHASVGLASDSWGTVRFGRQTNIASQFLGGVASPFGDAFAEAHVGNTFTSMATVRADNVISYVTPSFSGFRFGVGYSFNADGAQNWDVDGLAPGVSNPDDSNQKLLTVGLLYANGPLAVGASYDQLDSDNFNGSATTAGAVDGKIKAWNIAASYDFEVVKLHLGYGQERDGTFTGRTGGGGVGGLGGGYHDDYKANLYSVGLSAPVGTGSLMVGWAMADLSSGSFADTRAEDTQHLYSVAYTYPFSKRTNLYATGTYGTGYGFDDIDVTQVIVGLRHRF